MDEQQAVDPIEQRKAPYRAKWKGAALLEQVRQMKQLQEHKEVSEALLKEYNAELDVLRLETIPERMETDGVENVRYEGIGRVSLTGDLYVSVKAGEKESLFGWLKKRKLQDLIVPQINASTLKAFIKGRIKDGKEFPQDFLNVTPYTRASITKG